MAWTAPKTWADTSDTPSAADFNAQIRDNMSVLKVPFNSSGKVTALSSAYLDNLTGQHLWGPVKLNSVPGWLVSAMTLGDTGTLTKTAASGWDNSGAEAVEGRGAATSMRARWTVPASSAETYFGLSDGNGFLKAEIDFAWYLATAGAADSKIVELGVDKVTGITISVGDVLDVEVSAANVVKYFKNGTLVYTSLTAGTGSLWLFTQAYTTGQVLTGMIVSATSDYTAKQNLSAAASMVLPVGADKWAVWNAAPMPGSIWVEGNYLHYISATGVEWKYYGLLVANRPGAVAGSLWVDATQARFITETGNNERYLALNAGIPYTYASALPGSFWVEGDYLHFIIAAGVEKLGHYNVAEHTHNYGDHSDHDNSHSDEGYSDAAHSDHTNDHQDGYHSDVYYVYVCGGHDDHTNDPYVDDPHTNYTDHAHHSNDHHENVAHTDDPVPA